MSDTYTAIALATTEIDPHQSELCGFTLMATAPDGTIIARLDVPIQTSKPIPAEATAIHGITNAISASGMTPAQAADLLANKLTGMHSPLIAFNAPWVFAHINALMERTGTSMPPILTPVIDPLVLDKKNIAHSTTGRRQLKSLAPLWGIPAPNGATWQNAYASAMLAHRIISTIPQFRDTHIKTLSMLCQGWYYEFEEEFRDYLRSRGKEPQDTVMPWPDMALPTL